MKERLIWAIDGKRRGEIQGAEEFEQFLDEWQGEHRPEVRGVRAAVERTSELGHPDL